MGYKKAECVLPMELVEQIQKYVDGEYLYIPRKTSQRQAWGTKTDTKRELHKRNTAIYQDYRLGIKTCELAEKYYLSEKSIWRILHHMRK